MQQHLEKIQEAFNEENLNELVKDSWNQFLNFEKERNQDKTEFFSQLENSAFFFGMYNAAYRTGIVAGVKLLEEAVKK